MGESECPSVTSLLRCAWRATRFYFVHSHKTAKSRDTCYFDNWDQVRITTGWWNKNHPTKIEIVQRALNQRAEWVFSCLLSQPRLHTTTIQVIRLGFLGQTLENAPLAIGETTSFTTYLACSDESMAHATTHEMYWKCAFFERSRCAAHSITDTKDGILNRFLNSKWEMTQNIFNFVSFRRKLVCS